MQNCGLRPVTMFMTSNPRSRQQVFLSAIKYLPAAYQSSPANLLSECEYRSRSADTLFPNNVEVCRVTCTMGKHIGYAGRPHAQASGDRNWGASEEASSTSDTLRATLPQTGKHD